jgi:hypothetical protein
MCSLRCVSRFHDKTKVMTARHLNNHVCWWTNRYPITIAVKVKYASGTDFYQNCAVIFLNHMFQKLFVLHWQG